MVVTIHTDSQYDNNIMQQHILSVHVHQLENSRFIDNNL